MLFVDRLLKSARKDAEGETRLIFDFGLWSIYDETFADQVWGGIMLLRDTYCT